MPRQNDYNNSYKRHRHYSPSYQKRSNRRYSDFSEAQTDQDDSKKSYHHQYKRSEHRSEKSNQYHQRDIKYRQRKSNYSPLKKQKRSKPRSNSSGSFSNSSQQFQRSKLVEEAQRSRNINSPPKDRPKYNIKSNKEPLNEKDIPKVVQQIIQEIQKIDYEKGDYNQIKWKFMQICKYHVKFIAFTPWSQDLIGKEILKDGIFHQMWSKIILKSKKIDKQQTFLSYYSLFRSNIKKNLSNFQSTFNPIPDQNEDTNADCLFKQYRKTYEQNTRSTSATKMDIMILFQQVKSQIKSSQIQQKLVKKVQKSIQEFKIKNSQQKLPIVDPNLQLWFNDSKSKKSQQKSEQFERRKQQIQRVKKQRVRQKSPLSNRFRMMHQVQSNQRRMNVEMACVFFQLQKFYFFSDLHILKIDETIFSQNQEIIVLKAYSVDFCPSMGKMKIEPKIKNLVGVYKFIGLQELIRLQKTHGKFDGIIVYPECFNVRKYLTSTDSLSLIKDEYLKQIQDQLPSEQNIEQQEY